MDLTTSSSSSSPTKNYRLKSTNKRPDSLKLELLTVPENGSVPSKIIKDVSDMIHVGFSNLTYTVEKGLFKKKSKSILKQISGKFAAGELTAIMGPSGAGKTSLMNILAGYWTSGVKGHLLINDKDRVEETFKKQSTYIMQNDELHPLLSVYEAMMIAANLKFTISYNDKKARIKEILELLNLWVCRTTLTQSLSGGEKKRLTLALELLKPPQVLFFDEPTSGLDNLTAKQCILLLKQIALTGCTVICSIHQPSATIFELFDHLYALANGQCIYQGCIKGLIPYLEENNLICPTHYNPADFLLEVANGDYGNFLDSLIKNCDNGKNLEWCKSQHKNNVQLETIEHINKLMEKGQLNSIKPTENLFSKLSLLPNNKLDNCLFDLYPTSFFNQTIVLMRRQFLTISRDKTLTYSRISAHFVTALLIGIIYMGIGVDASNVLNNFNYMFFTTTFLMLTAFNCITLKFPSELPIIVREHFNSWYSLRSYYLAITLSDTPIQIIATVIYALLTYFLTMQPTELFRILSFVFMCILISLVAQSFGIFIGSIMNITNGIIFGPFCFLPFTIFSGFFVQLNNAHPMLRWIFHISFLKYGFEGLVLSVLGYDRDKLPCNTDYCHFVYPKTFLNQMDMEYSEYSTAVIFLISFIALIRIAAYVALSIQIRKR